MNMEITMAKPYKEIGIVEDYEESSCVAEARKKRRSPEWKVAGHYRCEFERERCQRMG